MYRPIYVYVDTLVRNAGCKLAGDQLALVTCNCWPIIYGADVCMALVLMRLLCICSRPRED